jgi:hypothetical protein
MELVNQLLGHAGLPSESGKVPRPTSHGPERSLLGQGLEAPSYSATNNHHWPESTAPPNIGGFPLFPPLHQVTRPTVPTAAAAYYLNRADQTLRKWACLENGPIRPIRINGRLAWKVSDLQELLSGGAAI